MSKRPLGRSGLEIEPLVLGTNVIGGTIGEAASFAVLDAFVAEGFTAIDTADVYTRQNQPNSSEDIIGRWMKARGNRDQVLIMTKVGSDMGQGHRDLSEAYIVRAVEDSLRRLRTDHIDLYQTHWPDPAYRQDETLGAYEKLVRAGKVRVIGCSNFDVPLLQEALEISGRNGWPRYETIQNEFNLYDRGTFPGAIQDFCVANDIAGIHYFSLARGFLSGKYRTPEDAGKSPRGPTVVRRYLNDKGYRVLAALDAVHAETGASHTAIALAWLNAQPGTAAPIASATTVAQVKELAEGARLTLTPAQVQALSDAGR